ncbi:cuticle protein 76-like [Anabrus simplex]|uniref:cuticle protein 76-like n=1 Tax=Anabrus simplex TaxID=316456 RepID=UPI0035A280B7
MELKVLILATLLSVVNAGFLGSTVGYTAAPSVGFAGSPIVVQHAQQQNNNSSESDKHDTVLLDAVTLHEAKAIAHAVPLHATVYHDGLGGPALVTKTAVAAPVVAKAVTPAFTPALGPYGAYYATGFPGAPIVAKGIAPQYITKTPLGVAYGAPYSTSVITKTPLGVAYASPYASPYPAPYPGPILAKNPLGVAYASAPGVPHITFDGYGFQYAY